MNEHLRSVIEINEIGEISEIRKIKDITGVSVQFGGEIDSDLIMPKTHAVRSSEMREIR